MKIHTLLITTLAVATLGAQEKPADPYAKDKAEPAAQEAPSVSTNVSVCYEDFSLPLAMAAAMQREQLTDAALYAKLVAAVGKDTVRQETFSMLRAISGQKATVENITEQIYPTEYQSPQVSNAVTTGVTGTDKDGKEIPANALPVPGPVAIARTPAMPSAFETRNTGFTLEIEPTLSDNGKEVDLRLVPDHVTLVGQSTAGQEFSTTEMPIFESQRINTTAKVKIGEPYLLGTLSRPPGSEQEEDSANRVWFGFVTAKIAK
jgi:hypothetical protein